NLEIVQTLANKKKNVLNELSYYGDHILFTALEEKQWNIFHFLVKAGANINFQNKEGFTILLQAISSHFNLKIIQYLVSMGADLNAVTEKGETALHLAACYSDTSIVDYLLSKGLDLNTKTISNETTLHRTVDIGTLD